MAGTLSDASTINEQEAAGRTSECLVEIPGRGHALVIDNGWRDRADTALAFVKRFA